MLAFEIKQHDHTFMCSRCETIGAVSIGSFSLGLKRVICDHCGHEMLKQFAGCLDCSPELTDAGIGVCGQCRETKAVQLVGTVTQEHLICATCYGREWISANGLA